MPPPASSSEIATDRIDAAPDAMLAVDADGRIVLANRQVEALFGYQRDELIRQFVEILVPEKELSVTVSSDPNRPNGR